MPDTDTVLHLAPGRRVDAAALGILLARLQMDIRLLIAKHGPDAVPGNPETPKYNFLTRTPAGTECYFFLNAHTLESLTYGLVNETIAGLKIFLLDQRRYEQVVFEVENESQNKALGGLSVGLLSEMLEDLSNDTSIAE